jgi:putative tryptophan/tyrosine transport system substrate-binding protein
MRRREFIAGLGSAAAWPLPGRAQQGARMRRIGVLMNAAADDPTVPAAIGTFEQSLQELSWTIGRNIQVDYRFGAGDPDLLRKYAAELFALAPDVTFWSAMNFRSPRAIACAPQHRLDHGRRLR